MAETADILWSCTLMCEGMPHSALSPHHSPTQVTPSSFTLGAVVPDGSSSSRNVVLLSVYQGMLHNAATQAFGIRLEFSNIAVSMLSMGQEYLVGVGEVWMCVGGMGGLQKCEATGSLHQGARDVRGGA